MNVSGELDEQAATLRATFGLLLGTVVLGIGFYRLILLPKIDPCLGPYFLLGGSLVLYSAVRDWRGTVAWFELTEDALHYRLVGRSTIRSVQLADVLGLRPLTRRRGTAYGIYVFLPDRVLRFDYDRAGNAVRLRDALTTLLPVSPRPPREGE